MKIDLHLHSKLSIPNGDSIKWESDYDSLMKLKKHNIKIAAFSDHNIFNKVWYRKMEQFAKSGNILLLPAIEANVVRTNGKRGNVIFVFNNELSNDELLKIENISKTQLPKVGVSLKNVNLLFKEFDPIIIPHVGKSDFLSYEDLIKIKCHAFEITNKNHPNFLSINRKNINSSIVAFSDTHIWKEYPQHSKNLITNINNMKEISFNELKNKLKLNKDYTKEII